MDVIYTDRNRIDTGVLHEFDIDFDTTDTMDYVITVGLENNLLAGGCWWYVDGTEYGGIVDAMEVLTDSCQIRYSGRSARGILNSRIIEPSAGMDYRTVSGNLADIARELIADAGINDLFAVAESGASIESYNFERYTTLYQGLVDAAFMCGRVLALKCLTGSSGSTSLLKRIEIEFVERLDYSNEMEFSNGNIQFRILKGFNTVNHLICLGKGELKDRLVAHLYVDRDGDIVEEQHYFGLNEITQVYELSGEESEEKLKKAGADKLGEIKDKDRIEVIVSDDLTLKIGDVIGGYESVTGISVKREITNIVAKIDDYGIDLDYRVGGDEPGAAGLPSEIVEQYVLPVATRTTLGGIIAGATLNISQGGVLHSEMLAKYKETLAYAERVCA